MKTISPTPGPWHIEIIDGGKNKYVPCAHIKSEQTGRHQSIASIQLASIGYSGTAADREQEMANARAIVATPDLLAALIDLREEIIAQGIFNEKLAEKIEAADLAIAKATYRGVG